MLLLLGIILREKIHGAELPNCLYSNIIGLLTNFNETKRNIIENVVINNQEWKKEEVVTHY